MRITAPDATGKVSINDSISGRIIVLYFRVPTTRERIQYSKSLFQRKGNKITYAYAEARQKWGREILTGFEEGAFGVVKGDKEIPYSSNPESKNYREDWKNLVCEFASDLVEILATHVFEGSTPLVAPRLGEEEEETGEEVDEKN
jgi:hypothetical protein